MASQQNNNDDSNEASSPVCYMKISPRQKCSQSNNSSLQQSLYLCAAAGCDRYVHPNCSFHLLNSKEVPLTNRPDPSQQEIVFCTIVHQRKWFGDKIRAQKEKEKQDKKAAKEAKKAAAHSQTWEGNGTLKALLDWWTTEPNYSNFLSGHNGKGKKEYCKDLSEMIRKETGIKKTPKEVSCKIQYIETAWRKAEDWKNQTGVGVLETEGEVVFKDYMLRLCSVYYDLEDVMAHRPNATPLCTNMDNNDDDDDDDEDDNGDVAGIGGGGDDSQSDDDDNSDGSSSDDEESVQVVQSTEEDDIEPVPLEQAIAMDAAVANMPPLRTTNTTNTTNTNTNDIDDTLTASTLRPNPFVRRNT